MNIIIFDTECDNFYPITLTRPVWDIRSGCFTQRERIEAFMEANGRGNSGYYYFTLENLAPFYREKFPEMRINDYSFMDSGEDALFINSSVFPDRNILELKKNTIVKNSGTPVLGLVERSKLPDGKYDIAEMLAEKIEIAVQESDSIERAGFIWDLIKDNGRRISMDSALLNRDKFKKPDTSLTIAGDTGNLYIEENVKIDPFVFIDVTGGPVIIREGSVINSFTRIEGPCYIGRDCVLLGAKVREGCSFGDSCRAGGEVEETIFQGYSNKYHDGFLGHSYIGEWVNLGAMTTNSDLKNDYSEVKVYIPAKRRGTGSIKAGCFIGDFVKTSIGTLITTGASIGVGAMAVHSGQMVPYHLPPFSWFIDGHIIDTAFFGDFLDSCARMTSRRGVEFSGNYRNLLKALYEGTDEMRKKEIEKWKRTHK